MQAVASGVLIIALAAALPSGPQPARLHFELSRSAPEAFATVDSVAEIRLWFTEVPAERTTAIRVVDQASVQAPAGDVVQDVRNARVVSMALRRPLPPGRYTVMWEARGPDGHLVHDSFPFVVASRR